MYKIPRKPSNVLCPFVTLFQKRQILVATGGLASVLTFYQRCVVVIGVVLSAASRKLITPEWCQLFSFISRAVFFFFFGFFSNRRRVLLRLHGGLRLCAYYTDYGSVRRYCNAFYLHLFIRIFSSFLLMHRFLFRSLWL